MKLSIIEVVPQAIMDLACNVYPFVLDR